MALPVTITGISTAVSCVGPYQSSGGNYYFFGKDGTTATTLQAFKATDPTISFSSIATKTGFTTAVQYLSGYQNGDIIHLCVTDGATTSVNYKYQTFNMSSDTFVTAETIVSAINTQDSASGNQYSSNIVFRGSDSQPVVSFSGARVATMGTSYAQVYYSRRTGVNTWAAAVQVSAGGAVNATTANAVLGSSSRSHLFWATDDNLLRSRTLNSSNVLQTAFVSPSAVNPINIAAISYSNAGTTKVVVAAKDASANFLRDFIFDSADTPSFTEGSGYPLAGDSNSGTFPNVLFNDKVSVWALFGGANSDLYVNISTDDGLNFIVNDVLAFTGTVAVVVTNLSIDSNIYTRGSSVVIPYVVNDNGTLKYNEYVVRTIASAFIANSIIKSRAVARASTW